MALNIRDPEMHRLARAVADATGETMTEAVKHRTARALARSRQVSEAERRRRFAAMMEHGPPVSRAAGRRSATARRDPGLR